MSLRPWFAAALALAIASSASAAVKPFVWRTVSLLGGNSREHMYLVSRHGSADGERLTDSVFVYERSNSDPRWTQRSMIRATLHRLPTEADSTNIEAFVASLDLAGWMVDHSCNPPFFLDWPESVAVDAKGMYCHERGVRSYFMTREEVASWLDYDVDNLASRGADLRAVDLYRTTAKEDDGALTDFVVVRAGSGGDAGQYEAIVAVEDAKLQAAAQEVKRKLPSRKKSGAAHK